MKIYSAQFKGTTTVATGSNVDLTGSFSGSIAGIDINATNQFTASTSTRLTNIEIISASNINRITSLETKSASVDISISNINAVTASNIARLSNLETKSSSVDISITNINSFTASNGNTSLNLLTGSLATTGSNSFFGTQVFSGSVYIANDLIVQGSSSIQYISASSVSIGTNIVQLNTANPSVRYAGLSIIDSGSIGGSGSFLYDSVQDEFIFVHRGNGTNITSSHFVLGPETYDSLGNETYLTSNIIPKGTGKEHLVDSCIFDNGTTTCIKNNLVGTGTISGTTIYGSTAVCSSVGKFTTCIDAGSVTATSFNLGNGQYLRLTRNSGALQYDAFGIVAGTDNTRIISTNDFDIVNGGLVSQFKIAGSGAATFACGVGICGSLDIIGNTTSQTFNTRSGTGFNSFQMGADTSAGGFYVYDNTNGVYRFTIKNSGIATFACQVCSPTFKGGSFNGTTGFFSCHIELNDNGSGWIYAVDKNHSIIMRGDRTGCIADFTNYYQYGGNLSTGKGHNFWTDGVLASQTIKMQIANNGICMTVPLFVCANGSAFGTAAGSGQAMTIQAGSNCRTIIFKNPAGADGSLWLYGTSNTINYSFSTYSVGDAFVLYNNGTYDFAGGDASDIRLKENITTIDYNATEKLMQLVSKSYNMIKHPDTKRSGFIAQEVKEVLPDFVTGEETEKDYLGIDYNGILSLAIKAIQEQQCTINLLKSCIGIV